MTNEVRGLFEFVASGGRSVLYDYGGGSRGASTPTQEPREWSLDKNGVIISKPIPIPIEQRESTISTSSRTYYDMSGPTNPNQVYKCGTHDYETKNLTEFNQHIESHSNNSKAASIPQVNEVAELFDF